MSNEQFTPTLPEFAVKQAEQLIEDFKVELKKAADEVIGTLYTDVSLWIEGDSWGNFRNQVMGGYRDYYDNKASQAYDFKVIRESLLREHREEIIEDLNQDMVEKIAKLEETIESLRNQRSY